MSTVQLNHRNQESEMPIAQAIVAGLLFEDPEMPEEELATTSACTQESRQRILKQPVTYSIPVSQTTLTQFMVEVTTVLGRRLWSGPSGASRLRQHFRVKLLAENPVQAISNSMTASNEWAEDDGKDLRVLVA